MRKEVSGRLLIEFIQIPKFNRGAHSDLVVSSNPRFSGLANQSFFLVYTKLTMSCNAF